MLAPDLEGPPRRVMVFCTTRSAKVEYRTNLRTKYLLFVGVCSLVLVSAFRSRENGAGLCNDSLPHFIVDAISFRTATTAFGLHSRGFMPDLNSDRRVAPRAPLVWAAEVVELPRGAKFVARTSDVSRTGCYVDTLNPIPTNSQVRIRLTHENATFEALGRVIYVSPGLGMGITFVTVAPDQQGILDQWLADADTSREF